MFEIDHHRISAHPGHDSLFAADGENPAVADRKRCVFRELGVYRQDNTVPEHRGLRRNGVGQLA